jgi:hypothetical protein
MNRALTHSYPNEPETVNRLPHEIIAPPSVSSPHSPQPRCPQPASFEEGAQCPHITRNCLDKPAVPSALRETAESAGRNHPKPGMVFFHFFPPPKKNATHCTITHNGAQPPNQNRPNYEMNPNFCGYCHAQMGVMEPDNRANGFEPPKITPPPKPHSTPNRAQKRTIGSHQAHDQPRAYARKCF